MRPPPVNLGDDARAAHRAARRAAAALALAALAAAAIAMQWPLGTRPWIGPGLFPLLAASGLLVLALSLLWRPAEAVPGAIGANAESTVLTLAGVALFALLLPWTGSVGAASVTGALASRAAGTAWRVAVVIGLAGSGGLHLLLVLGLGHRLPLWP
jgi:hypothetical protein